MKYTVIRDSNEQQGHGWVFGYSNHCTGTKIQKMPTGDYTLEGYENILTIERKGSLGEFAKNIVEGRFENELKRLEDFDHPFMILEFSMEDIMKFPVGSGIPKEAWPKLKITKWYIIRRITEYEMIYKTKIILAGPFGKEMASSIFKRVVELHGEVES